jgi:hypothetical protein
LNYLSVLDETTPIRGVSHIRPYLTVYLGVLGERRGCQWLRHVDTLDYFAGDSKVVHKRFFVTYSKRCELAKWEGKKGDATRTTKEVAEFFAGRAKELSEPFPGF